MADLHRSDFDRLDSLASVKHSQLSIVAPSCQHVGVLWIVFKTEHGRSGTEYLLRFVRILWNLSQINNLQDNTIYP